VQAAKSPSYAFDGQNCLTKGESALMATALRWAGKLILRAVSVDNLEEQLNMMRQTLKHDAQKEPRSNLTCTKSGPREPTYTHSGR
jgi:hypothetical protein